jgi:hypothetical protein
MGVEVTRIAALVRGEVHLVRLDPTLSREIALFAPLQHRAFRGDL